jgi:hypothetical protein
MNTVAAIWKADDDSLRVLYARFAHAITMTLAREGECFARSKPWYPEQRIMRWSNGRGTVFMHWAMVDTFPSPTGPTVRPPTLTVGVTLDARSLQDYFDRLPAAACG